MYLILSHNDGIHGIDYTKGLEDTDMHCGKVHKYWTVKCRPVLLTKKEAQVSWKKEDLVNYDSFSDDEKLVLGEPIFWLSSLHRYFMKPRIKTTKEVINIDVNGEEIDRETTVENR